MTMRAWVRSLFRRPAARPVVRPARRVRLTLEGVEGRDCPATFTVTNTLGDASVGSIRWAVGQANASAGPDTVAFDPTVFATAQTISLGDTLELGDTTGATTIAGPAVGVTLRADIAGQVVQVYAGATAILSKLSLTGGFVALGNGGVDGGGGLFNDGTATLTDCTITNNYLQHTTGGGVQSFGKLTMTNCTTSKNRVYHILDEGRINGGGLSVEGGTATLTNCTISGNSLTYANSTGDDGGGVFVYDNAGSGLMAGTGVRVVASWPARS